MSSVTYYSNKIGKITITTDDIGANCITIETDKFIFNSLNKDPFDLLVDSYTQLLTNPNNIKHLNNGQVWDRELVKTFLITKIAAWNNGASYGFFSGYEKKTMNFIGSFSTRREFSEYEQVGRGHGNVIEMGGVFDEQFWHQGIGSEAAIIAKKYIKHCLLKDQLQNPSIPTTPLPIEFVATVHPNNTHSVSILKKRLTNVEPTLINKYGEQRFFFFKPIKLNNIKIIEPATNNNNPLQP